MNASVLSLARCCARRLAAVAHACHVLVVEPQLRSRARSLVVQTLAQDDMPLGEDAYQGLRPTLGRGLRSMHSHSTPFLSGLSAGYQWTPLPREGMLPLEVCAPLLPALHTAWSSHTAGHPAEPKDY